ncbi:hypothetical protein PRZ48_008523 [Zasmidium cellare]|uniref:Beta-glucuronidase C-terminal domain-containing protein n=1 Tax=Zasmidium cellare TaxID=395010 RepID=A0ABR0EFR0_ZASCE|nr:hypothetical protein PRZ48_008523 [Zasmidium cellare]
MSSRLLLLTALVKTLVVQTSATITFAVPSTPPANASKQLLPAPIGVSIEFFAWPGYTELASTEQCLQNLEALTGTWPRLRIGGTTQDRATYNASSSSEVTYSVASPSDAPASLTYGPSFLTLAGTYNGSVLLGLNRQLNNLSNTISAAKKAVIEIDNLNAIELGNEPNFYASSSPINTNGGSWTASDDFASQTYWQSAVGGNLSKTDIISAGVYFSTSGFSIQGLTSAEGNSNQFVKDYSSHNYPQSQSTANLPQLMNHSAIAKQISPFKADIAAANAKGKPHIMGETNSATQGGGGISPMFGSGLWVMDYSLQMLYLGTEALYFHQGTIGNCPYCWWGRYSMGTPYYGAYFATLALAGADQIAPLDNFSSTYGAWAIYSNGQITKVLLYNSDYYASGTRSSQTFKLTGLGGSAVSAIRLSAPFSTSRQDHGQNPTVGGQTFQNGTCAIQGTAVQENTTVADGAASFTVYASEALLVYLLALQQYIWREALSFNIHPSVPTLSPTASVADVAGGTALWLVEVGRELGPSSDLHAFDVNLQQAPPKQWLPDNLALHEWNFFEDVPEEFVGKFDLVHVRLITVAIKANDPVPVIKNLCKLLSPQPPSLILTNTNDSAEPGGHLQWDEVDVFNTFVVKADPALSAPSMDALCAWINAAKPGQKGTPENDWRKRLTGLLVENGFDAAERHDEGKRFLEHMHLMRYNNDQLMMLYEQYARRVFPAGSEQGLKLLKMVEAAARDAENGALLVMPPVIWVARKAE